MRRACKSPLEANSTPPTQEIVLQHFAPLLALFRSRKNGLPSDMGTIAKVMMCEKTQNARDQFNFFFCTTCQRVPRKQTATLMRSCSKSHSRACPEPLAACTNGRVKQLVMKCATNEEPTTSVSVSNCTRTEETRLDNSLVRRGKASGQR